jgi:hypothetical protein
VGRWRNRRWIWWVRIRFIRRLRCWLYISGNVRPCHGQPHRQWLALSAEWERGHDGFRMGKCPFQRLTHRHKLDGFTAPFLKRPRRPPRPTTTFASALSHNGSCRGVNCQFPNAVHSAPSRRWRQCGLPGNIGGERLCVSTM